MNTKKLKENENNHNIKSIAYKFRIYPNKSQQSYLIKSFIANKHVYNYYLDKRIGIYEGSGGSFNYSDCSKDLTFLKQTAGYEHLAESSSAVLQSTLRDLDTAYSNFFRRIKKGDAQKGFPKFKSFNSSLRYTNTTAEYLPEVHKIKLSKIGKIKVVDYIQPKGKLMNMTISQSKAGLWYVSMCMEVKLEDCPDKEKAIGIDVGLKHFAITSDGEKIDNPKFLKKSEKKVIRLQRQLSRKEKGSRNRNKARIILAKAHDKVASQRKNFLHQLSTNLTKENGVIAIEDLNIKGMVKNKRLAKSISDVSWSEFFRQLEYKGKWYNSNIIKIGRFEPSSKTCNVCGYYFENMTLADRTLECPNCHNILDRDINAAKNILVLGLKSLK